jgi:hypothetical protein
MTVWTLIESGLFFKSGFLKEILRFNVVRLRRQTEVLPRGRVSARSAGVLQPLFRVQTGNITDFNQRFPVPRAGLELHIRERTGVAGRGNISGAETGHDHEQKIADFFYLPSLNHYIRSKEI